MMRDVLATFVFMFEMAARWVISAISWRTYGAARVSGLLSLRHFHPPIVREFSRLTSPSARAHRAG
jgi:hypothetical protein